MGDEDSQHDGHDGEEGSAALPAASSATPATSATERKDPTNPMLRRFRAVPEDSVRRPEKGPDDNVGKSLARATPSHRPGAPPPNLASTSDRPPARRRASRDEDKHMLGDPTRPRDAKPKDDDGARGGQTHQDGSGSVATSELSHLARSVPARRASIQPDEVQGSTRLDLFLGIGAGVLVLAVVVGVWMTVQSADDGREDLDATTTERGVGTPSERAREPEWDDGTSQDAVEGEGEDAEGQGEDADGEDANGEDADGDDADGDDADGDDADGDDAEGDAEHATSDDEVGPPATGVTPTGLAMLPEPREEIRLMNPWVRRNRAGEVRAEARRLMATGDDAEAATQWSLSLELFPESAEAQLALARTLVHLGRTDEALAWARRAVDTDPSDPRAHEHVGDILLTIEHRDEALTAYRAGLEAAPRDIRLRSRIRRLTAP